MKITRSTLKTNCEVLNRRLNRPTAAWTRNADKSLTANVGHLFIQSNAPGDGWTRYQVCEMMEHGGVNTLSMVGTASEILFDLRALLESTDGRFKPFPENSSFANGEPIR